MAGTLRIYIGPNGYGKTTRLDQIKNDLISSGENVFAMPSEILLLDEVKDSKDTTQTMEFLLSELIRTPKYEKLQENLFNEVDSSIAANLADMNKMLDDVLSINGSSRSGDFIASNSRRTIKNLVSINQKDVKDKMGSGQRMGLLLKLASNSSCNHIFLDEPEKYSHPSMLHSTAEAINDLVYKGKSVYIATHSPKLISMLRVDYSDIRVINDNTHVEKDLPFDDAVKSASRLLAVGSMPASSQRYYSSGSSLKNCIQRRHNRQFIEAIFAKRIYLCEGANDELLINAALQEYGGYYDDYAILKVWGKLNIPVFAQLFSLLGIEVCVLYDKDFEKKGIHKAANKAIRALSTTITKLEQDPNLESELDYTGKKGDALAFLDHLESNPIPAKFDFSKI